MKQPIAFDLEAMSSVDIRTVDPASLNDILDTNINSELPFIEKALDYIKQIGNPYCFRCGDTVVKVSHSDSTTTISDCMESYFRFF